MYHFCSEEAFLQRLKRYVEIETPTGNYDAMQSFNDVLEQDLLDAGASVTRYPSEMGDVICAEVGEGPYRVLLLAHKDTVFPVGTLEKNPFRVEERDGQHVLRGPGVFDMKGGVCMAVELLRHFAKAPVPGWKITALFNSDEETGSQCSRGIICTFMTKSEYCLCMEPANPGQCVTSRKGIASFKLIASGVSAHSGTNYLDGASAAEALCRVIAKAYDLRDDEKGLSINIGLMNATGARNIVCDHAEAQGEFRSFDPAAIRDAMNALYEICSKNGVKNTFVEADPYPSRPPMEQKAESKQIYEIAAACAEEHGLKLAECARGGGSDAAFASHMNVPVLDGLGVEGGKPHTANEFAVLDTIQNRLRLCADLIVRTAASGLFQ